MRIALAQLNYTVGAFESNFAKMSDAVARARRIDADLIVFSEMAATGYPPRDLLNHSEFVERNLRVLDAVAGLSTEKLGILIGFVDVNPAAEGKRLRNAVALCYNGTVASRSAKMLLPTYDVFDEDRYFEPATEVKLLALPRARLGVSICEDLWNDRDFWPARLYHRDPVCELVDRGAELLINISASPFSLGKPVVRHGMVQQEARKHGLYFFYLNQVGGNDELIFDGHSLGVDPRGDVILRGRDFEEDFLVCDISDRGIGEPANPASERLHAVSGTATEEAYKALVLGLRDYARKCGFAKAVLGLSGGVDSSLTACLAADALGPENVLGVAMPTRYSSEHSLRDAEGLAANLGVDYRVVPIDDVFQCYLEALGPVLGGSCGGVAEENLQPRIRGAILMAISNSGGQLVLSTGNKSELGVGYCTLYGDMCGGLAVINDVPKTLVYDLAYLVNRDHERIPSGVLTKAPSAELRPNQKDEDTLPPYAIVDAILEAYVERNMGLREIVGLGQDTAVVADIIRRINASEYKRRQAAPGLKITSKAFGVGRRYPMAADYRAVQTADSRR
ncbi:MAG: NAD+ synthase [Acidobacteria bacterium]|nr:NAD+ synthase [Acidobacteriota bacterium]